MENAAPGLGAGAGAGGAGADRVQDVLESILAEKNQVHDQFVAGSRDPQMYIPISDLLDHDRLTEVNAWEAPATMRLDTLAGATEEELGLGGLVPKQSQDKHVFVSSADCKFGGKAEGIWKAWLVFLEQTDVFLEVPRARWDVDVYYDPDGGQFNSKSSTKHAGFIADDDLMSFDNKFFGIPDEQAYMLAPNTRMLLESSYVCCHNAGHNFDTLRGHRMALYIADIGTEFEPNQGLAENPDLWAVSTFRFGLTSGMQLALRFQTTGPVQLIDTACSSSLVGASMGHAALRHESPDFREVLVFGHMACMSPFTFVGLSSAGMLGRGGRCLTFDNSANGYNRGEGVGGLLMRTGDEFREQSLAHYISSFINQDGRSASLTAPNGPSQQAVMRNSMKLEEIDIQEMVSQENHGTGTALGDPIEVGSVRSVFRKHTAIPVTSGKTHLGHLESTAGSVGLLKTLVQLMHAAVTPNVHLNNLNAHIDITGFPGLFPTELTDTDSRPAVAGINGFGFGGTNCRSELWAAPRRGPRAMAAKMARQRRADGQPLDAGCVTEPCPRCLAPKCWRCGQAYPREIDGEGHSCRIIRAEYAMYDYCSDCYDGAYQFGTPIQSGMSSPADRSVYLAGSWNSWSELEEMRQVSEGLYVGEVCMGSMGSEMFHLVVNEDRDQCIVPVGVKSAADARIVGPLQAWRTNCWLIDGRADRAPEGTVYEVRFEWTERSKLIAWRRLRKRSRALVQPHTFSIVCSQDEWRLADMVQSDSDPSQWEFTTKFRRTGDFQVYFLRDGDPDQMIFPLSATHGGDFDSSVPVIGPCPGDTSKTWAVSGVRGDSLTVRLCTRGGQVEVQLDAAGVCRAWSSDATSSRHYYYLVGTFCDWSLPHAPRFEPCNDPGRPGLYTARFRIGDDYSNSEGFQIAMNKSWEHVLHPSAPNPAGHGFLCGPEAADQSLCWVVSGETDDIVEVALDFAAPDHFQMVTARIVGQEGEEQAALRADVPGGEH